MTEQNGVGRSATEELCRMLDERGVEHTDAEDGHTQYTWWSDGDHEIAACNSGKHLAVYNLTPEQAIAATLGSEPDDAAMVKLHERMNAALLEFERAQGFEKRDGDGAVVVPFVAEMHSLIEEAATLGRGTCHMRLVYEEEDADGFIWPDHYECDACGANVNGIMPSYDTEIQPRYCPNCGRKVVGE